MDSSNIITWLCCRSLEVTERLLCCFHGVVYCLHAKQIQMPFQEYRSMNRCDCCDVSGEIPETVCDDMLSMLARTIASARISGVDH